VVILGAGGAGGTLALKAVRDGAKSVSVFDINMPNGVVNRALEYKPNANITGYKFCYDTIGKVASSANILINATPLGMHGVEIDFTKLDFLDNLREDTIVYDLVYNPAETKLLQYARRRGLRAVGGLKMLIYQAVLAQERYFSAILNKENSFRIMEVHHNDTVTQERM
jgi:shikimate 5-dehydrogenase